MNFNDVEWHDSIIKKILIDRNNPGNIDSIEFEIEWINQKIERLIFSGVYWANLSLNFGIIAEESILNAYVIDNNDKDLAHLNERWKNSINISELRVFILNLNSTGGTIKIIAKNFHICK